MQTEIEAKFPDIDAENLRRKLKELGATQEHPELLMRRNNYDYPEDRLDAQSGWVRVRDEGPIVTLSYKHLLDRSLHGMKELTIVVDSFDKTCEFLEAIGMEVKSYQETKREKWLLGAVEVTLDTWPWIPTFVELEGKTEENVKTVATQLGLNWSNAMYGSVEAVYQMHYDFSQTEINHWKTITFVPEPDWLLAKKKVTKSDFDTPDSSHLI